MRSLAASVIVTLLAGCASTRPQPAGGEPCDRVASLASDGELKPAIDEWAALEEEGVSCPKNVSAAIEEARARLAQADALVRDAQSKKQRGELAGAATDLERALAVYPKYYWAQKLLREVEQAGAADRAEAQLQQRSRFDARLAQARAAEARGDLAEASRLASESLDSVPTDPDSRAELVEYSRLLGLKLFSEGELTRARDLWQKALVLDPSNQKIRDYLREVNQRLKSLEKIKSKDEG